MNFLLGHKDKQIIKVVSGIRRCGKSTLFEIYKQYLLDHSIEKSQIISINLEDITYQDKNYKELYFEISNHLIEGKMTYIFLDEIQNCKNFEKMVDSLFIKPNVDIYITGSNAYFMSGELATLLSGRYVELKMLPLSFKEYSSAIDSNKSTLAKYNDYITYSSFPYTLKYQDNLKNTQDYLRGIYSTILLKEVVQRYKITDVMMLESVTSFVFDNIGNRLSTLNIANILTNNGRAITDKTVEKYLQALIDSLIIYQVKRYNIKGGQLLKTQSKYYVADLGLRYLICGIKGQDEGHILENIVYLELLRRGYNVTIGQNDTNEIDFVATNQEDTLFIQVSLTLKSESTYLREITPLKNLKNSYPKLILTLDEAPIKDDNGIKIIYALDWLLK
ncbi:MAG: ATP-binding protein [Bacilli bacterium]